MKVLIVEDEKAAVRNLKALLANVAPHYEIVGTSDSILGTIDWLENNPKPDIIFMDIHLADGSAFEIFERVKITTPVIFTTAYDEYALKAFRVNSIDYLLKPIGDKDIKRALDKFETLRESRPDIDEHAFTRFVRTMSRQDKYKTHFLIPAKGSKLIPLSVDSIDYFYVLSGVVRAMTKDKESVVIPNTMEELTDLLNPEQFFRINRQYLLTRESIKDIELWFNGRLSMNLKTPVEKERIIVSKARVHDFKEWFAGDR